MIPVAISIVTGIPTHILTKIIENFAQVPSLRNGNALEINPHLSSSAFTGPQSANKLRIINKETNCGTAIVITKIVRKIFFPRKPLVLINNANKIPKKKLVAVAATAQISVQDNSGINVSAIRPVKIFLKFANPTQSNKCPGGK